MSAEPFYDDDGELVGYLHLADDNALVLSDLDGTILSAITPDGQPLDHTEYGYGDDPRGDYVPQEPEQEAIQFEIPQPEPDPIPWTELGHQKDDLEKQLGRGLTTTESAAITRNVLRQLDNGAHVNVHDALEHAWSTGDAPIVDLSTHDGKVTYVMDQLQRQHDERDGLEIGDPPARQADYYDMSTTEGKTQYLQDRASGALSAEEAPEHMYDSRDDVE